MNTFPTPSLGVYVTSRQIRPSVRVGGRCTKTFQEIHVRLFTFSYTSSFDGWTPLPLYRTPYSLPLTPLTYDLKRLILYKHIVTIVILLCPRTVEGLNVW